MKRVQQISVFGMQNAKRAAEILGSVVGLSPQSSAWTTSVVIVDDPELNEHAMELLGNAEIPTQNSVHGEYNESEILEAPLAHIMYLGEVIETDSSHRFAEDEGCPACGSGARQIGALKLEQPPPDDLSIVCTNNDEWLIHAKVYEDIGTELLDKHSVRDLSGWNDWFEIVYESCLPPAHKASTGLTVENQCKECMRDGYFYDSTRALDLVYEEAVLSDVARCDFIGSWELMGPSIRRSESGMRFVARPMLFVGERHLPKVLEHANGVCRFTPARSK